MSAVNPIPVVRNNLPAYRLSLLRDKAKHLTALEQIDADLKLLDELAKILDIGLAEMAVVDDEPLTSFDPQVNG